MREGAHHSGDCNKGDRITKLASIAGDIVTAIHSRVPFVVGEGANHYTVFPDWQWRVCSPGLGLKARNMTAWGEAPGKASKPIFPGL